MGGHMGRAARVAPPEEMRLDTITRRPISQRRKGLSGIKTRGLNPLFKVPAVDTRTVHPYNKHSHCLSLGEAKRVIPRQNEAKGATPRRILTLFLTVLFLPCISLA